MKPLELLDRAKISIERRGVRLAAHTRKSRILVSGRRIGNGARWRRSRGHIAEGVDQVRQFIGYAILLQIRNIITGVIDAPFLEVAPENLARMTRLGRRLRDAGNEGQQTRQSHSKQRRQEI